jgi:hypothetical protein
LPQGQYNFGIMLALFLGISLLMQEQQVGQWLGFIATNALGSEETLGRFRTPLREDD